MHEDAVNQLVAPFNGVIVPRRAKKHRYVVSLETREERHLVVFPTQEDVERYLADAPGHRLSLATGESWRYEQLKGDG